MTESNSSQQSRLSFWTGSKGSFPYFVASGKSSPGNNHPRLLTGMTTPIFKKSYPDFPRILCFFGSCSIAFEGINILGYNFANSNNYDYLGIIFVDFPGDSLIQRTVEGNSNLFGKCNISQTERGCIVCLKSGSCSNCNTVILRFI